MRNVMLSLALVAIALAGCADEPSEETAAPAVSENPDGSSLEDNTTADPVSASSEEPSAPETNETAEPGNVAPVANLTATPGGGEAPATIQFDISVSDADGDALVWTLDADGDGMEDANGTESGSFEFTFMEGGEYTANLTVSDGDVNATALLPIVITAKPPQTETYTCDVVLGYGVDGASVTLSGLPVNLGGCSLVDVPGPRLVLEVEPGNSCSIEADLDGDGFSDEPVEVGRTYNAGNSMTAFCYTGAVDVTNSVTLEVL